MIIYFICLGITTTGTSFQKPVDDKLLPCFTIYPNQAFKKKGFFWNSKSYNENTYKLDELLDDDSLKAIGNTYEYWLAEEDTVFYGKMFTICFLKVFIFQDFKQKVKVSQNVTNIFGNIYCTFV